MTFSEFEEKQFESAANIELSFQNTGVFAAGQVLEGIVGYDVAANQPKNAPIWGLIGANAPPGIQLVPNHWNGQRTKPKAASLPSTYVSLVIQYKRPAHLNNSRAAQWHHWQSPYYRFKISNKLPTLQHDNLKNLEVSLAQGAVVVYACPAFYTYADLQSHQLNRTVLRSTNFVLPSAIGTHSVWSYQIAGNAGYANPTGEVKDSISLTDLWNQLKKRGRKQTLLQHVHSLATKIAPTEEDESLDWSNRFSSVDLNGEQLQGLEDVLKIGTVLGRLGASWSVVDLEEKDFATNPKTKSVRKKHATPQRKRTSQKRK